MKRVVNALPDPLGSRLLSIYRVARGTTQETRFSGWGMETRTHTPWHNNPDPMGLRLAEFHSEFQDAIRSGDFVLSQFSEVSDVATFMDEFLWREYFILASVTLAHGSRQDETGFSLVECGVCDGWSGWFAMKEAATLHVGSTLWAYDSWAGMREQDLLSSELSNRGDYHYLDLRQTQRNLREFGESVTFCPGYLPGSFDDCGLPDVVHWLHIDLNSALPTEAALTRLWSRIPTGGVVLLDDYDWPGYEDTKCVVDSFFASEAQWVLALPTGQGLVIRST